MITERAGPTQFLILADESAEWKIAGLQQLDRIILALNEFAESSGGETTFDIAVFWKPDSPVLGRRLPHDQRMIRVQVHERLDAVSPGAQVLSTRLFVDRDGLAKFLQIAWVMKLEHSILEPDKVWRELFDQFLRSCATDENGHGWHVLKGRSDLSKCTRKFLNDAGKPQDGMVSRFLNRLISRLVTRALVKYPISPTVWTISIFILPLLASAFLLRGDYASVVAGAALFQLYSILDGCDGEIARAKYLESERGARLDDFCDTLGSLLFVIALGFGLARVHSSSAYAIEGIVCAIAVGANEWFLRSFLPETDRFRSLHPSFARPGPPTPATTDANALTPTLYPRHRGLVQNSGLLLMGENFVHWVFQLTKRDVAILFFLLLALANLPQWILHLWLTIAAVTLVLSGLARFRVSTDRGAAVPPRS